MMMTAWRYKPWGRCHMNTVWQRAVRGIVSCLLLLLLLLLPPGSSLVMRRAVVEQAVFPIHSQRGGTNNHVTMACAQSNPDAFESASSSSIMNRTTSPVFHHFENTIERVFCLSDLHTDHIDNQNWLRHRMQKPHGRSKNDWRSSDLLVIAGDISHDLAVMTESLRYLRDTAGCQVLFVAGNHEAWLQQRDRDTLSPHTPPTKDHEEEDENYSLKQKRDCITSLDKMERVYQTCRNLGVMVDPCQITTNRHSLWIVPIQSWYDGSLSFSEEHCQGFAHWPWVDFMRCRWPERFQQSPAAIQALKAASQATNHNPRMPVGLVEYFLEQNNDNLKLVQEQIEQQQQQQPGSLTLMTVSHFLPNQQCLPDFIDLSAPTLDVQTCIDYGSAEMSAKFAKVAGSQKIDDQLRNGIDLDDQVRHIHVFGHSHRPKDFEYRGIRYVHNPLGKPRERLMHMVNPEVDFQLLWDAKNHQGVVPGKRILRYWEEYGGGREALWHRLETVKPQSRYVQSQLRDRQRRNEG